MDEEAKGILRQISAKLDKLAETLARIEGRSTTINIVNPPDAIGPQAYGGTKEN